MKIPIPAHINTATVTSDDTMYRVLMLMDSFSITHTSSVLPNILINPDHLTVNQSVIELYKTTKLNESLYAHMFGKEEEFEDLFHEIKFLTSAL